MPETPRIAATESYPTDHKRSHDAGFVGARHLRTTGGFLAMRSFPLPCDVRKS